MSKAVVIPECSKDIGGMKEELSVSPNEKRDGAMGLFSRLLRLDSLGKKNNSSESSTTVESPTTYYGVYIPCEIKKGPDEEALHVYKNKSEVMELIKKYKLARFKAFKNRQDALSFALRGADTTDTTDGNDNSLVGEKPYPFKAPSPQDMVALRKSIEAGLACTVRDRVWDNPRFLVSSGNTPSIMQTLFRAICLCRAEILNLCENAQPVLNTCVSFEEGSRYNALHIAAKSLNAEMCNIILTTVGNPMFIQTLYGIDADPESCKEFASILVDRYLNTPDKAMNETPLHFAVKFGGADAVDVLTSFPQCNRHAVNKFGEQPKDIICMRSPNSTPETARRISLMLQQRYYVPVLHSEDGSALPTIGRPFTPPQTPELNQDPLSPRYEIRAYAGPMEPKEAESFRRCWKTPPRNSTAVRQPRAFRLKEMTKGLETVGRSLAEEMKVDWKEYWPFLDTFTNLRTIEGLTLLENYLKIKYENACSGAYSDSCAQSKSSPDELSLSRICQDVTGSNAVSESMSPISELCAAMKTCKISNDVLPAHWMKTDPVRQRLCRQPNLKTVTNGDTLPAVSHTVSQLLCIERTCQVFAKRIADALTFSLTAEPQVAGESLRSEAKHLQHTIFTYMDDERFQDIDFALTHSRLAQLVVYQLKQRRTKELDDVNNLAEFLMKLRCPNDDVFSSDDERKPLYRGQGRVRMTQVIDEHVRCLSSFICEELTEKDPSRGPAISDSECSALWEKASKCRCDWRVDFERNSKRNASFRKNRSILSTSPKNDSFIRRLTFDQDIGDGKQQLKDVDKPVSVNSPAGDSGATLYTVVTAKCQVVDAEISDDDSIVSCRSDNSNGQYFTASDHSDLDEDSDGMEEAIDRAIAEPFIYGEEPTKMDRLVYEAVADCLLITEEQFPNVYRWRHTVALYSLTERNSWQPVADPDDSTLSCASWSIASPSPRTPVNKIGRLRLATSVLYSSPVPARCSTPNKDSNRSDISRDLPLQVSNWLRVTGPNSPRSALAAKNVGHNVSFGF